MTYSQPTPRQVQAFFEPSRPDKQQVGPAPTVRAGPVGELRVVAGASDRSFGLTEAMGAFFAGFAEPAQKAIADWQEKEREEAAAAFIDANPEFNTKGLQSLSPEARGALDSMDYRVKQKLMEYRVTGATLDYGLEVATRIAASDILKAPRDPNGDPVADAQRRGAERARIEAEAAGLVGLSEMPALYRQRVLAAVAPTKIEALGQARQVRAANEYQLTRQAEDLDIGNRLLMAAGMTGEALGNTPALTSLEASMVDSSGQVVDVVPIPTQGLPGSGTWDQPPPPVPVAQAGAPSAMSFPAAAGQAPPAPELPPPPRSYGETLSVGELTRLVADAGMGADTPRMVAIAMGESSGRRGVVNDNPASGDLSVGIWQINMIGDLGPARRKQFGLKSNDDLKDPEVNLRVAREILKSQGWTAWGAYNNKSYEKFLPEAEQAYAALTNGGAQSIATGDSIQIQTQERQRLARYSEEQARQGAAVLEQGVKQLIDRGRTPAQVANSIQRALLNQLQEAELSPRGDYAVRETQLAQLGKVQALIDNSTWTWGGLSLGDIPNEKGITLNELIRREGARLSRIQSEDPQGMLGTVLSVEDQLRIANGELSVEEAQQVGTRAALEVARRGGDPSQSMAVRNAIVDMQGRGMTEIERGSLDKLYRQIPELRSSDPLSAEGVEAASERIWGMYNRGEISAQAAAAAVNQLTKQGDYDARLQGYRYLYDPEPTRNPLALDVATQSAETFSEIQAKGNPLDAERFPDVESVREEVRLQAAKRYDEKLRAATEAGTVVGPKQAEEFARDSINEAVEDIRKRVLTPDGQSLTQRFESAKNYVQQQLNKSNGQIQMSTFPQWIIDGARKRNGGKPPTIDQVAEEYRRNAAAVGDPASADGKPGARWYPNGNVKDKGIPLLKYQQQLSKGNQQRQQQNAAATQNPYGLPTRNQGPGTMQSVGSGEPIQETLTVPAGENPVELPSPQASNPEATPPGAPSVEEVGLGVILGQQLGVELIRRRQDDQLFAFDPMGAVRSLMNGSAVERLERIITGQEPLTPTTPPLPQVKSEARLAPMPTTINSETHPAAIAIGVAEGTRRADGSRTPAWYGHEDPNIPGRWNIGTYSANAKDFSSPEQADAYWNKRLTSKSVEAAKIMSAMGMKPNTVGWHRVMFNVLDLEIQAPAANRLDGFLGKLKEVAQGNFTVEAIAKARAESYINPQTGRLETSFASFSQLLADQRRRAGAYDYKRRL